LSIFTQTNYDFIPFLIQIKLNDLNQVELVSKFRQFIKRLLNFQFIENREYKPFEKRIPNLQTAQLNINDNDSQDSSIPIKKLEPVL